MLIHKHLNTISLVTAALIMSTLAIVRKYIYLQGPMIKGAPEASGIYLVSTACIIITLLLVYFPLQNSSHVSLAVFSNNNKKQPTSIALAVALSVILTFLLFFNQPYFNSISYEDQAIEWLSFFFLLAGAFLLFNNLNKIRKTKSRIELYIPLLFFLALYILIAMEEVSWFTRLFNIETPELFDANAQNEINLHNFFTDYSENLYYVGTHLYFVAIPVFAHCLGLQNHTRLLRTFLAKPHLIAIAMIASAYNYNMWNSLFVQFTFFSSVIALLFLYLKNTSCKDKMLILLFLGFLLLTQTLYLSSGERYQRIHEITEFKEMFIALTLFIYALDIHAEIKSLSLKEGIK